MKKKVRVVGAIIENNNNEILCALRSLDMTLGNFWEFAGGKIEDGESYKEALEGEILEELSCRIEAEEDPYDICIHEYEKVIVELTTLRAKIIKGTPVAREHKSLLWLDKKHLGSLNWAPADVPAVKKLISEKIKNLNNL